MTVTDIAGRDPAAVIDLEARHFDDVLEQLAEDGRLVHRTRLPARPPRFAPTTRPIDPEVTAAIGDEALWVHQAQAIDSIREGRSVVVATGTASGKSRCYQIPIAEAAGRPGRTGTALLL